MAQIARTYLGNIYRDSHLARSVAEKICSRVILNQSDRSKGRIHAYTDDNIAVGIIKNRDRLLDSGDVFQTESQKLLLICLKEQTLLVLNLSTLKNDIAATELIRLGHALGNHHCAIAIRDSKIYVQTNTEPDTIEKIITDFKIPGLQIAYEMQDLSTKIDFTSHSHS